jgi:hypothetical protein
MDFVDLMEMWPVAPRMAERFWEMLKSEAGEEFESGHLAMQAMYPVRTKILDW